MGNTIQRIPMTPELQAKLGRVAASASERVVGWLFSDNVPEAVVRWLWRDQGSFGGRVLLPTVIMVAISILYTSLFAWFRGNGVPSLGSTVIASAAVAALVFGVFFVATEVWRRRIARSSYIIRERGMFAVGSRFRAVISKDRTRRSIWVAAGELRLDGVESDERLAATWEQFAPRGRERDLEIDYTSNRYLLAIRRLSGEVLWSRTGYEPPVSGPATPRVPVERRSSWLGRLWLLPTALLLLVLALGSLYAWTLQPPDSPPAWALVASFFASLIFALAAFVVAVYRLFVAAGDGVADIMARDRS
jgi:hypothetical protein